MQLIRSQQVQTFLLISLGAVLGANARYWLGGWIAQRWGSDLPFATLAINLAGSFVLAFFMTLVTTRFIVNPAWRILFAVGFLGSYTTFSTYTYESVTLLLGGSWLPGLLNLFGSAALGGLAAVLGVILGRLV